MSQVLHHPRPLTHMLLRSNERYRRDHADMICTAVQISMFIQINHAACLPTISQKQDVIRG